MHGFGGLVKKNKDPLDLNRIINCWYLCPKKTLVLVTMYDIHRQLHPENKYELLNP